MIIRNFFLACVCAMGFVQAETADAKWILDYVQPIPDFPKKGIVFQWYAQLLRDPIAFHKAIDAFAKRYQEMDIDAIAGLDSRGFIFGAALAYKLQVPFILVRKPGKLPGDVERIDYTLEYGTNTFEVEKDSVLPGQRVLVIDDLLATGGTAAAACALVERSGAEVAEVAVLIELGFLNGREKITQPVFSLILM